ncbi:MAG: response regulator [SAR324 cluster bacterium]|nr:response regulator [SAR324 cluster bacterium]
MNDLRVLIADDDPKIAEIHRRFTEKVPGFVVVSIAHTLAEAEEYLEVLEPQLALLDIYFPDGSGIDLLRKLRSGSQETDIIPITAAKEVALLQESMRGGVFDYILKPVVFSRFENTLLRYREHRHNLGGLDILEQQDVDRLLGHQGSHLQASDNELPKGIDPLTLEKVKSLFRAALPKGANSEEIGARVGVSRTTARRYLEHLVAQGVLVADLAYGSIGRPERRYFSRM